MSVVHVSLKLCERSELVQKFSLDALMVILTSHSAQRVKEIMPMLDMSYTFNNIFISIRLSNIITQQRRIISLLENVERKQITAYMFSMKML